NRLAVAGGRKDPQILPTLGIMHVVNQKTPFGRGTIGMHDQVGFRPQLRRAEPVDCTYVDVADGPVHGGAERDAAVRGYGSGGLGRLARIQSAEDATRD